MGASVLIIVFNLVAIIVAVVIVRRSISKCNGYL